MTSLQQQELILEEYREKRSLYDQLDEIVAGKLETLIEENRLFVMPLSHRLKTEESLQGKLRRRKQDYQHLLDLTDICGARIICYFLDTVDEIAGLLPAYFVVRKAVDKSESLDATQFGYLSRHFILSLREEDGYAKELCEIGFELQTRTVLQHAWAEIEHDLGYKSTFGVPRQLRREFSRIAGLLEIADNQFADLRRGLLAYESDIRERISSGEISDLPLDQVTLNEFVLHNRSFTALAGDFADRLGMEYVYNEVERYLPELDWLGIHTIGELYAMLERNEDLTARLIRLRSSEIDLSILTTSMLLRYFCRAELIAGEYTEEQIRRFLQLGTNNRALLKKYMDIILELKAAAKNGEAE